MSYLFSLENNLHVHPFVFPSEGGFFWLQATIPDGVYSEEEKEGARIAAFVSDYENLLSDVHVDLLSANDAHLWQVYFFGSWTRMTTAHRHFLQTLI